MPEAQVMMVISGINSGDGTFQCVDRRHCEECAKKRMAGKQQKTHPRGGAIPFLSLSYSILLRFFLPLSLPSSEDSSLALPGISAATWKRTLPRLLKSSPTTPISAGCG